MKTHHIVAALVVATAACSSSPETVEAGPPPVIEAGTTQTITTEFELRTSMRKLWEEHVFWTRIYIMDAVGNLPETSFTATRLQANQDDIADAVRPFYGDAAANQLASLLHAHIDGAAAVLKAAVSGDQALFTSANNAWYANGYQIAALLASANPNWSLDALATHMNTHLDRTLAEASARLKGDWAGDVAAYDSVVDHIVTFADFLSGGIVAQFPKLIGPNSVTPNDEALHVALRKLWEDHVQWTRIVIVDQTAKLPDLSFALPRLLKNQDDIGAAIVPFYGTQAGSTLASLLHEHITGAVTVLLAFESGDQKSIASATDDWYANADAIVQFLAAANPHFRSADLTFHMHLHLDQTIQEAAQRLAMNWDDDITSYDAAANHILEMSDALATGINAQFPGPAAK
jgi:hypothetical protein